MTNNIPLPVFGVVVEHTLAAVVADNIPEVVPVDSILVVDLVGSLVVDSTTSSQTIIA